MRIAIFSDVHGNMEAFEKVLEDLDRAHPDCVFSLGDNIGYGAEPERVLQRLRALNIPSVLGNHELAVRDPELLSWFNPAARQSLSATRSMLGIESLEFISSLPLHRIINGIRLVHGFPPDSATTYLFQVPDEAKKKALMDLTERICFVGHTHVFEIIACNGARLIDIEFSYRAVPLDPALRYFINIGSVGQPRDGDVRAKYVIWDSTESILDIRCIPYDVQTAADKIRAAGLPEQHARRLFG